MKNESDQLPTQKDKSPNTAKMVVTSGGEVNVADISILQNEFTESTKNWISSSFGPDAVPILKQIKQTGRVYVPAVGMMDSFMNAPDINDPNWRPMKSSDLSYGIHMAKITLPNGTLVGQAAAYTALELLDNKEMIQERNAREWLIEVLNMPDSEGAVLNPKTRFMLAEIVQSYLTMNRFGVAEITGFLEAPDLDSNQPFYELANRAFEEQKYYQVLYYWSRAYRSPRANDDWRKAEIAKLKAYHQINFPGSRERTYSELDWMLQNHPSEEIQAYKAELEAH